MPLYSSSMILSVCLLSNEVLMSSLLTGSSAEAIYFKGCLIPEPTTLLILEWITAYGVRLTLVPAEI